MKGLLRVLLLLGFTLAVHGQITATAWIPMFKGIDRAAGTNATGPQVCNVLRIDLQDPDVQFLPYPRAANYVANSIETTSLSLSNFIKQQGVKVATAANFY